MCIIWCLASFAQHFVRFTVCGYRLFIRTAVEHSTVRGYPCEFIHSTADGHLGSVQFGTL